MTAGCRKLAAVSFTAKGCRLNALLCQALSREGYDVEAWGKEPYAGEQGLTPLTEPLKAWTGRMFQEKEGILFIGASDIQTL